MKPHRIKKSFSLNIYSKNTIIRTTYDFMELFDISLNYNEKNNAIDVNVIISCDNDENDFWRSFNFNLIDNSLRESVNKQTSYIRNILFRSALNESLSKPISDIRNEI